MPPGLTLDMFEGTDAKEAVRGAAPGEETIRAFESATGCTIYRGWPICDVCDVRRCYPELAGCSDVEAWMRYERAFVGAWRPDRARLYCDFFNRHLAVGEMGASLSHLRVAERAHAEGLDLQVVFEDDSRPTAHALPALLEEVAELAAAGIEWDLIYLHSAHYGRRAELPAPGSTRLRVAGHRKVCHAYALSANGAAKLACCNYRRSVFPYDDFLPALHAGHPRPDVMRLACVQAARGERTAAANGDGDGDGDGESGCGDSGCESVGGSGAPIASPGFVKSPGFVGLTFADEAGLCTVPPRGGRGAADSDSKAGGGSSVLLGDTGTQIETEAEIEVQAEIETEAEIEVPANLPAPVEWRLLARPRTLPPRAHATDHDAADADASTAAASLRSQLEACSYAVVRVGDGDLVDLLGAEEASARFFRRPTADKVCHVGKGVSRRSNVSMCHCWLRLCGWLAGQ